MTTNQEAMFQEELPLLPPAGASEAKREETETSISVASGDSPRSEGQYSLVVAICFALNYSIGAGILGLPFEFYSAGYVLSTLMIVLVGFLSYITNMYIVDAIIRAESITSIMHENLATVSKYDLVSSRKQLKQRLMDSKDASNSNVPLTTLRKIRENYVIHRNEYQLNELIGIFGGKWWRLAYDITFGVSTLVVLWSYNVLFGVSLARNIGIGGIAAACNMEAESASSECRHLYSFWVSIFWIWSMTITLIDFTHQQWLQVVATSARIFIIALMVITSIGLMYSEWYYDGTSFVYDESYSTDTSNVWQWSGVFYMVSVAAFAFGNQFCIPDIIGPLSHHDKQHKQHVLWSVSVFICAIVYTLCGVTISIYFGGNTQDPCTLAWGNFMGWTATDTQPVWALLVSWCVVLLPAIDIGSAFPLVATTLANTFEAIVLALMFNLNKNGDDGGGAAANADDVEVDTENECLRTCYKQRYVVVIKIVLCTVCSALALIEWDFELILVLAGSWRLLAMYAGPCVLQWKSKQFMNDVCRDNADNVDVSKTKVTRDWIAHPAWLYIIVTVSLIAFIAVFVQTIQTYS